MRFDVIAVKRDLRLRKVGQRALEKRLGHVLAHLADLRRVAAVQLKKARERLHRLVIAALDHEHPPTLIEIGEHRHVLMPAPARGLIDPRSTPSRLCASTASSTE